MDQLLYLRILQDYNIIDAYNVKNEPDHGHCPLNMLHDDGGCKDAAS